MSSQILEISNPGLSLKLKYGFVQVFDSGDLVGQVVIDDILCVVISTPGCMISTNLIDRLVNDNIPISICGKNYLPTSITLPAAGKGRQYQIMCAQAQLTAPKRKRCWQAVVKAKITNQATLLEQLGVSATGLYKLVKKTRSGDPHNCEAQAARQYWQRLFGKEFRRNRDAHDLNSALNYSYAVLRSCMARGIVAAGLHPTYSLHHKSPQNPINLVDDLMEPFRPVCDSLVNLSSDAKSSESLSLANKQALAKVASVPVIYAGETSPLSICCVKLARSFANHIVDNTSKFELPQLSSQIELAASCSP